MSLEPLLPPTMNTSREKKSNRSLLSRISPRSANNNSSNKVRAASPQASLLTVDNGAEDEHLVEEDSFQSPMDAGDASDHLSTMTDEDPVEMIKKLRKSRLSKGIKAVKGASRSVVKGSQKVARGAQRTISGGVKRTKQHDMYDVEAVTENDPLLTEAAQQEKAPPRNGAVLWEILRNRRDEVVFMPQHQDSDSESVAIRKTRRQKEIVDEFRNALQFSLTHCLVAIFVYLMIAVLAYSFVFESWSIIDSMYFAVVSFTTIGFGDIVPTTDASRMFTAFFALSGVACLGIALGVLGSNLVEAQTKAIEQASELSQYQVMSLFDSSSKQSNNENATNELPRTPWYRSTFVKQVLPLFTLLFLFCWLLGNDAGWNVIETFYFCLITATTGTSVRQVVSCTVVRICILIYARSSLVACLQSGMEIFHLILKRVDCLQYL